MSHELPFQLHDLLHIMTHLWLLGGQLSGAQAMPSVGVVQPVEQIGNQLAALELVIGAGYLNGGQVFCTKYM